jgi:Na+-driven multidrug efflux pump
LLSFVTGLGDATTPFVCALLFNVLNFILDPIFIFRWKLGVSGAALTTAVSQTIALVPLLWILNRRVSLRFRGPSELLKPLRQYIKASFYLLGRSVARIAAFSYCSRQSVSRQILLLDFI